MRRIGYFNPGCRSLHPLDGNLNLPPDSYSHGIRKLVARETARGSFDDVVETVEQSTGVHVPKRQTQILARGAATDFDAFYEQKRRPKPYNNSTGPILVMSTDGKGIVMHHKDLRPATKKAAKNNDPKLQKRPSKGEKRGRKRMSQVATVYTMGRFPRTVDDVVGDLASVQGERQSANATKRPSPENKRVWASVEKDAEQVIGDMVTEACRRDPWRRKTCVVLVDGCKHQLASISGALKGQELEAVIILDIIHVLEYLWKASHAFFGEGSGEGESWVTKRFRRILEGRVVHVAAGIRRSATRRGLKGNPRKVIDICADYLLNHADQMKYDQYLAQGLPIATGVIEGACRHLVKDRMDLTGARWSLKGAEAVLKLRALRASDDFQEYWEFHENQELKRNHYAKYEEGRIPPTITSCTNGLRLVK